MVLGEEQGRVAEQIDVPIGREQMVSPVVRRAVGASGPHVDELGIGVGERAEALGPEVIEWLVERGAAFT